MDFNFDKQKSTAKWVVGVFTICILIFLGVQNIGTLSKAVAWVFNLILPLILGLIFAMILDVPMRLIEANLFKKSKKNFTKKLQRPIALIISLLLIIGIIVGIVWLVIPELADALKVIFDSVTKFVDNIKAMDKTKIAALPFGNYLTNLDFNKVFNSIQPYIKNYGGAIMNSAFDIVNALVGGVLNFVIALVFAIYILFSKENLKNITKRLIHAWLPRNFGDWSMHAVSVSVQNFRNFVSGQTLEGVILGVLCLVGMLILKIPYAPMVSALVGVTALIPVVGAFVGAAIGAFMILTVEPIKAVIFVIFLVILQQIEGNLIYPKVMGSKVNLPALWILAAVTIGGGIAGPVGMLLSVPVFSTIYILIKEATINKEEKLKMQEFSSDKTATEE